MFFKRCQIEILLTRYKIYLQFYEQINQLYVHLLALPLTISCGNEPILSIELEISTWRILPWSKIYFTADLLAIHACQLQRQDKDLKEATLHLQQMRLEGKERHNNKHDICIEELTMRQIVLLHNIRRIKIMIRKHTFQWLGLYGISNTVKDKSMYMLGEYDKLQLAGTFADNRLKKFQLWQQLQLDHVPNLDYKKILDLDNYLAGDSNSKFLTHLIILIFDKSSPINITQQFN